MNEEAWPTPRGPSREPLPRVEDLPIAEQGYEQESVRAAFDSFYRHAAQLDAALRTLEAVDSFHRQAAALRADLRTLRTAGWTQQPWTATPTYGYTARASREGISPTVWRIAGEAALLIAVAVALGVAKLVWWLIVLVMLAAWIVVGLIEWTASRDRWPGGAAAAPSAGHPVVEAAPPDLPTDEDARGWSAFEEVQEPSDAMTMIGTSSVDESETPAAESEDAYEAEETDDAEPDIVEGPPADLPRRRWWRRGTEAAREQGEAAHVELPHHVRVLPAEEARASDSIDPWEQGFDTDERAPAPASEAPDESALSRDADESARRRFRRR